MDNTERIFRIYEHLESLQEELLEIAPIMAGCKSREEFISYYIDWNIAKTKSHYDAIGTAAAIEDWQKCSQSEFPYGGGR